jgi:hypothetical protein
MEAEAEARGSNGKDDIIFWKLIYKLHPKMAGFYWRGEVFSGLPALGRDLLERLWAKDKSRLKYFESILSERLLTEYAQVAAPNNEELRRGMAAIEDSYELDRAQNKDPDRSLYLMAYTISGQKLLNIDGQRFRTAGELASYMREQLEGSYEAFERLCHKLVDFDNNLDVQLEMWLIAIGKHQELENWRSLMRE